MKKIKPAAKSQTAAKNKPAQKIKPKKKMHSKKAAVFIALVSAIILSAAAYFICDNFIGKVKYYTVIFSSEGGSAVEKQVCEYGSLPAEPKPPLRENYLFCGWYKDTDFNDIYNFDTAPDSALTLLAKWVPVSDALTYGLVFDRMTITGYKPDLPERLIMPEIIDGFFVENIGDRAFANCDFLTEVSISNKNTLIGNEIFFGCTSLIKMTVPLRENTLAGRNYSLAYYFTVTPKGDNDVPSSLKTVCVTDGVSALFDYAFAQCKYLSEIKLPDSIVSIGRAAFINCESLTSVNIPKGMLAIGDCAFQNCYKLNKIEFHENITSIGMYAFKSCISLDNIYLPENISFIAEGAFEGCKKLSSIALPSSLTEIKDNLFRDCISLKSITLPAVTKIGYSAFYNCLSLTAMDIPSSVTEIGFYAFCGCNLLNNVVIPSGVKVLQFEVFSNCLNLTDITLNNGLTEINSHAFSYCTSLSKITIPSTVNKINEQAFFNCSNLASIVVNNTKPPAAEKEFIYNCNQRLKIYVPAGSLAAYKAAVNWSAYASLINPI